MAKYSDLSLDLIPHPVTGDLTVKNDYASVKQAVRNLIMLSTGDKPFHPEIATNIRSLMFENVSPLQIETAKMVIANLISKYEPRVKITMLEIMFSPDEGKLDLYISFTVINLANPVTMQISVLKVR